MPINYVNPPELVSSLDFSHAAVVEAPSRTVYIGGQNGVDGSGQVVAGLGPQTAKAFDNAAIALQAAGAELSDVVSWTIAVVAGQDLQEGFAAARPALRGRSHPPLLSVLQVVELAVPGALIEVTAIAVLP